MFEQGDILHISGIRFPVLVVTKNIYNETGRAIVCPLIKESITSPATRFIPGQGTVLCDQVRFVDLTIRDNRKLSSIPLNDILEISSIIESLFDHY